MKIPTQKLSYILIEHSVNELKFFEYIESRGLIKCIRFSRIKALCQTDYHNLIKVDNEVPLRNRRRMIYIKSHRNSLFGFHSKRLKLDWKYFLRPLPGKYAKNPGIVPSSKDSEDNEFKMFKWHLRDINLYSFRMWDFQIPRCQDSENSVNIGKF